jgi:RHS repeat-associated protein
MPMLPRLQKPAAWRDPGPVRRMTSGSRNPPPFLSVTVNTKRTCSVYGACGTRLKKIENLAANANCAALPVTAVATVYFGAVEVRNWQVPGQEVVLTYPSPAVKLTNGVASYLHRDHLGSVRAITDAAGARVESAVYKPFGEQTEFVTPGLAAPESKGWIGERYDADASLQYLNARYYDPVLGMFLQPDWWEVLQPGVGTNRFSYSFNDPVNKIDPLGNYTEKEIADEERTIARYAAGEHRDTLKGIDDEIDDIRGKDGIDDEDIDRLAYLNEHRRRVVDQLEAWEAIAQMTDEELVAGRIADASSILAQVMLGPVSPRRGAAGSGAARVVCSFDADTLVLSERGLVPIASIRPLQDRVWSTHEESGNSDWNMVLAQSVASYDHEVLVTMRDPDSGDEQTITSNRIHPYFAQVPESEPVNVASEGITYAGPIIDGRWIDAGDLKLGYRLLNNHGAWVEVTAVEERPRDLQAWNLTVEAAHSFYVAETVEDDAVWVHNSCVSANVLNHIFGKPSHKLDDLLASFDGDQVKAYEAVLEAATGAHKRGTLSLGPNGVIPTAGNVFNINGNLVQLSGGRLDPVTGLLDIRSFSGVVRLP